MEATLDTARKLVILNGWMESSNQWYTSMEFELRPGVVEKVTIEELKAMVACDLMDARQYSYDEFWVVRYRVSKQGKEWMKNPPKAGAVIRLKRRAVVLMIECDYCDGEGVADDDECPLCAGSGQVPAPQLSEPEPTLLSSLPEEPVAPPQKAIIKIRRKQ